MEADSVRQALGDARRVLAELSSVVNEAPSELSPLGRLNLTLLRRQFASPLASVRKILTDLMGVITQEPQPQQVRRFLKLQRDHGSLQWQLASVRRHIEAARTALERGTASDAASFQRTASVLQNIANDLKLSCYVDLDSAMVTLAGNQWVMDFTVDESGRATTVKVAATFPNGTAAPDDGRMHKLETALASSASARDTSDLRATLGLIELLDRAPRLWPQVDATDVFFSLSQDMREVSRRETEAAAGNGDALRRSGHGVLVDCDDRASLCFAYFAAPRATRTDKLFDKAADGVFYYFVGVQETDSPTHFVDPLVAGSSSFLDTDSNTAALKTANVATETVRTDALPAGVTFITPLPTWPSAPLSFVLELSPPVGVSASLAAQLRGVPLVDAHMAASGATLEQLILPHIRRGRRYATFVPGSSVGHVYFLGGDASPALTVARVPFSSPAHVHGILSLLRQQLAYNELVRSCFAAATEQEPAHDHMAAIEVCGDAPSLLSVTFCHPFGDAFVSLQVRVARGGAVTCEAFFAAGEEPPAGTAETVNAVLGATLSVPLAVRAVLRGMERRGQEGDKGAANARPQAKRKRKNDA